MAVTDCNGMPIVFRALVIADPEHMTTLAGGRVYLEDPADPAAAWLRCMSDGAARDLADYTADRAMRGPVMPRDRSGSECLIVIAFDGPRGQDAFDRWTEQVGISGESYPVIPASLTSQIVRELTT